MQQYAEIKYLKDLKETKHEKWVPSSGSVYKWKPGLCEYGNEYSGSINMKHLST
jgi:hypothetical protein